MKEPNKKTAANRKKSAPGGAKPKAPTRKKTSTGGTGARRTPKPALSPPDTVVSIRANIGFGNQLFIRGEGAGLSWDRGVPMTCTHASNWEWTVRNVTSPLVFKVLINDQLWSRGENFEIRPGEHKVVEPDF